MTALVERLLAAEDRAEVARLAAHVTDWETFSRVADRHGVRGVAFDALAAAGALPAEVERREARARRVEAMFRDALSAALSRVLAALAAQAIHVVPLKGPVLAERCYPRPDRRPSSDLDLLLAPTDLGRAEAALLKLGYRPEGRALDGYFRAHHHHAHLVHEQLPTVELHHHAYRGFGVIHTSEALLRRALPYASPRWTTFVLAPEDELLYLAVHAAGHRFERLGWLYDLKLLLAPGARSGRALDWELVAARAREAGFAEVLSLTCELLATKLGVPRSWRGAVAAPSPLRARLARALVSSPRTVPARFGLNVLLCDTPLRAAGNAARLVGRKIALVRARG